MPNSNDPKPNDPNTPDPADAKKAKDKPTGQSSYEFDFAGSSPELPPVPLPESPDGTAGQAALPPRPFSRQPSQGSFDFIDLDADVAALSDPDVQLPPVPPLLTPTPNAVNIPPVPAVPPLLIPTPNAVNLPPIPAPTPIQPPLLTPTEGVIALPPMPQVGSSEIHIELPSDSTLLTPTPRSVDLPPVGESIADIDTLLPIADETSSSVGLDAKPVAAVGDSGSFVGGSGELTLEPVDSSVGLGAKPVAAVGDSGSFVGGSGELTLEPDNGDSGSFVMSGPLAMPQAPAPLPVPSDGVVELPPPVQGTFASTPDMNLDDPSGVSALLTPTPNAVDLPPVPAQQLLIPTSNPFEIPPVPTADLVTQYPKGQPTGDTDAELNVAPVAGGSGSFVMAGPQVTPTVPNAVPVPSEGTVSLPPTIPLAFTASAPEIDLGAASESPFELPAGDSSAGYPQGEVIDETGVNFGQSPLADGSGSFVMTGPLGAPQVPNAVPAPTDVSVNLPPSIPVAFTASAPEIDLGEMPDPSSGAIPHGFAASLPDVDLTSPSGTDLGTVPEGLIAASLPDLDLGLDPSSETTAVPVAFNASITDLDLSEPPAQPDVPSAAFATAGELNIEPQLESSQTNVIPTAANASITNVDLPAAEGSDTANIPMAFPVDSDEIIDLGGVPEVTAEPSSATIDVSQLSARLPKDEPLSGIPDADAPVEAAPAPSMFDFGLDDAAEPPPVQVPPEPSMPVFELPPVNIPGSNPLTSSLGSVGSLPTIGSDPSIPVFGSVPDIEIKFPQLAEQPKSVQPPVGSFPTPDNAQAEIDLHSVSEDATASTVGLGQVKPVATGDWLDSGIHGLTRTDPDVPALPATDASDIFSGRDGSVPVPGAGVEYSDVIKATAYPSGSDPDVPLGTRPSDVALNFNSPPGGTTISDIDSGNLPVAEAVPGSSALLGAPRADDESIHGAGVPAGDLLDSADLAGVRDLPSGNRPDFGAMPPQHDDASSILGGTEPVVDLSGGSAVDIARPGVPATRAGAFDLVPDEPTEGLFDEVSPSGSNLLENRTRASEGDSGWVDPTATELTPDTPSHLLSDEQPASGDTSLETDPDLEEAEFNAHPQDIRRTSSGDFELPDVADLIAKSKTGPKKPATADEGAVDWDAVSENEEATRGMPRDASLSALIREQMEENDHPTQDAVPVAPVAPSTSGAEVSIEWQDASGESSAAPATPPPAKKKARRPEPKREDDPSEAPTVPRPAVSDKRKVPAVEPASPAGKRKSETRSLFAGTLLGGFLAAGLAAGAYFGGFVHFGEQKPGPDETAKPNNPPPTPTPSGAPDATALLVSGSAAKAVEALPAEPKTVQEKATDGAVRLFARAQTLGDKKATADDPELEKARKSLQAVRDDEKASTKDKALATVQLGAAHVLAGDTKAARELYEFGRDNYPGFKSVFESGLARLEATDPKGKPNALNAPRRLTPTEAQRLVLELTVLLQDPKGKDADESDEPGSHYWKAIKLANQGDYDKAVAEMKLAKEKHIARAKKLAGAGLNPLTDPLEEMFPKACDEILAGWEARKRYDGAAIELKTAKADLKKAQTELTAANTAKMEAETDAKEKGDALKNVAAELKPVKPLPENYKAADLVAAVKEKATAFDATKKDLDAAKTDLTAAADALTKANTAKTNAEKAKADLVKKIATELKPVKTLPAEPKEDEVLAAVKSAADLASGDLAKKLLKANETAETARAGTKALQAKYTTDTGALQTKYDTDTKKLKDEKTELTKLTDGQATKINELNTKADNLDKAVKAGDAALKKARTDADAALLKARTDAVAQALAFEKQLANVISPASALDLWLPVLAELRRKSDADPAIAAARRARDTIVGAKSDDATKEIEAKTRTTEGMGLLLKADYAAAKEQFQLAVRSPAFAAAKAAGKYWTKVAENGLDATNDPLAPYRLPPSNPPIDRRAAAKALDAGINAYKAGRYEAAVTELKAAAENEPINPVAWYYLGAARWALGDEAKAAKDIAEGSERENKWPLPTHAISAALAPIQGRARDAIDKARP